MSTTKKEIDTDLINDAIDASIDFEALMEKIDFNSWLENINETEKIKKIDTEENLLSKDDKKAFNQYKKWVNHAEKICKRFINSRYEKETPNEISDKKQFVISLLHCLFKSKLERLRARRTTIPNVEKNKYIEGANILNLTLNRIPFEYFQKSSMSERKRDYDLLKILLYNDLSICYAGLKNSSMSRGFAEESVKVFKDDDDYIIFKKKMEDLENKIVKKIVKKQDYIDFSEIPFLSNNIKKYDLYTFALFCKGLAEYRSYLFEEAEKTFMEIINNVDIYNCHRNSDYFSTVIHLAALLIDLGRGKEAIEIIQKIEKDQIIDKVDRRWTESILEKASALIDRSDYDGARRTLEKLYRFKNLENESEEEKRYAEPILNGLINYGRSYLEEARNILSVKELDKTKKNLIKKAKRYLTEAYKRSKKRQQKSLIQKATKYLAETSEISKIAKDALKYYSISISEGDVDDFENLLKEWEQKDFVEHCEDRDILDNFSKITFKNIIDKSEKKKCDKKLDTEISFCLHLLNKLKKECDEKENLILSERAERRKEEIELIKSERDEECGIPKTAGRLKFEKYYKMLRGEEIEDIGKKDGLLRYDDMKARLDSNERKFDESLYGRTEQIKKSQVELIVLRRWNSFSPGLSRRQSISLGGGYLLRIWAPEFQKINENDLTGENNGERNSRLLFNIVVDPGYNFLHNFHSENFKIEDIDAIVVTHSHPDHCAELPGIMDLMMQINKRRRKDETKKSKRVYLLLSEGAYKKFSPYIQDWKKQLKDVILLGDDTVWPEKELEMEFQIKAKQTAHADLGGVRAIGILILIKGKSNISLGFTGDTPWRESVKNNFKDCDILCLHIGGIKDEEIGYEKDGTEINKNESCKKVQRKLKEANHLLFYGSKDIINDCTKQDSVVIVGEFGEELKYGLRTDIVKKLNLPTAEDPFCIPADSGLYLIITENKKGQHKEIRCDFCREFVPPRKIEIFAYGVIDSLHYICNACNNTLTESQKRTVVENILTRH